MNISDLPKDVLAIIVKQLRLREFINIRLLNKYFNSFIKEKFSRFWFKKYIDVMLKTGSYASHYGLPVMRVHDMYITIPGIDLKLLFIPCYTMHNHPDIYMSQTYLISNHKDDYDKYYEEAKEILKKSNGNSVLYGYDSNNKSYRFVESQENEEPLRYSFSKVYACSKIIYEHYKLSCKVETHFKWDVPKDENDDEWFNSHNLEYDSKMCYMSSYLVACYRIQRDNLDKTKTLDFPKDKTYSYVTINGKRVKKMNDRYKNSPFYNRCLKSYKAL